MADLLEIPDEQVEAFARAARAAIELRLQQIPEAERCDFWMLVAKLYARGIADAQWVWVLGAENDARAKVKALVTERVGPGVAFMPFHFSGWYEGRDMRDYYPKGTDPVVLGESVNTVTTYGFDPVTGMQETKATLCQIRAA